MSYSLESEQYHLGVNPDEVQDPAEDEEIAIVHVSSLEGSGLDEGLQTTITPFIPAPTSSVRDDRDDDEGDDYDDEDIETTVEVDARGNTIVTVTTTLNPLNPPEMTSFLNVTELDKGEWGDDWPFSPEEDAAYLKELQEGERQWLALCQRLRDTPQPTYTKVKPSCKD